MKDYGTQRHTLLKPDLNNEFGKELKIFQTGCILSITTDLTIIYQKLSWSQIERSRPASPESPAPAASLVRPQWAEKLSFSTLVAFRLEKRVGWNALLHAGCLRAIGWPQSSNSPRRIKDIQWRKREGICPESNSAFVIHSHIYPSFSCATVYH